MFWWEFNSGSKLNINLKKYLSLKNWKKAHDIFELLLRFF